MTDEEQANKNLREGFSHYDEVLETALFLPMSDIERLIERLTAERDGLYAGHLPPSEHGRSFGGELAANLNRNVREDK